jgi:hypothetical protein
MVQKCFYNRKEVYTEILWETLLERSHSQDEQRDGGIIRRWLLGKYVMRIGGSWKWFRNVPKNEGGSETPNEIRRSYTINFRL